jgi:uncharacterized membrane protein YkvA (DUF1232 family)
MTKKSTTTAATEQLTDPGFLQELWQQIKLVYYLLRDSDVPIYLKILPFAGIFYILFPIDFLPDVIPVLGQLDDLTVLIVGLKVFIEMAPVDVVTRYMDQMRGKIRVVEGEANNVAGKVIDEPIIIEQESVEKTTTSK